MQQPVDPTQWYQVTIIHPNGQTYYMGALSGYTVNQYIAEGRNVAALLIPGMEPARTRR